MNTYQNLDSIKYQIDELEKKRSNTEARLNKVNADYAHLQSIMDTLNTLLYDLKFSIPAIKDIYEVAKKYGKPLETIKALTKYNEFKSLQKDVDELLKRKIELGYMSLNPNQLQSKSLLMDYSGQFHQR